MIVNIKIARLLLIVLPLLIAIDGYAKEANVEIDTNAIQVNDLDSSADSAISNPSSGSEKQTKSSLFFPIDELHEVIRKERIESFLEINKQRKETLGYLTQERQAILNELKVELKRITDLIESERSATLVELEEIGQLIAHNTIMNSKQLIDHIFIRMLQFVAAMIISLLISVLIIYGIMIKRKKQS